MQSIDLEKAVAYSSLYPSILQVSHMLVYVPEFKGVIILIGTLLIILIGLYELFNLKETELSNRYNVRLW